MPDILFSHAHINRSLVVDTGANDISWSYNLNTQAFPTHGGEVVQVLSVNIDTITIQGEVRSYAKMEEIYAWFLEYMERATQGYRGSNGYDETPVIMQYPHRGWSMSIKPIQLPNMRYGREVIVPQWQVVAHVVAPDPETQQLSIDQSIGSLVGGDLDFFEKNISADIGFRSQNPFSDPNGLITQDEKTLYGADGLPTGVHVLGEDIPASQIAEEGKKAYQYVGKQMSSMFEKLANGEVSDIFGNLQEWLGSDASKPSTTRKGTNDTSTSNTTNGTPLTSNPLTGAPNSILPNG